MEETLKFEGSLRYWNDARGWGIIEAAPGMKTGGGIFLHVSNLADKDAKLTEGCRLTFETQPNTSVKHPLKAVNVVVVAHE